MGGLAAGIGSLAQAGGQETRGWMEMGQRLYREGQENKSLRTRRIPPPPRLKAYRDYILRILALNLNKPPVSALDYFRSGGTARFNLDTPMTPSEAIRLGIVGRGGEEIPFFDPEGSKTELTEEQLFYEGKRKARRGGKGKMVRYSKAFGRSEKIADRLDRGGLGPKERRKLEQRHRRSIQRYERIGRQLGVGD